MQALRILHLEDDPFFAEMAETLLKAQGMQIVLRRAESLAEFETALRAQTYDLIISDHEIPDGDGLKALSLCRRECPTVPFIFLSGRLGEELAIDSLKNGAADYVLKSSMSRFIPTVMRTLNSFRETAALRAAEARIRRDRANLHGLIENTSDAIWSMDLDCNVLAFNSAASLLCLKLTGQPMVEGVCFLDRLAPALQSRWRGAVERVRGLERFQEEQALDWTGGREVLEVWFHPILSGREVGGIAIFAKDITARKRIETAAARLDQQRRRLASAYRKMRLPLHGLSRMAGLLGRTALDAGQQRFLGLITASVRRLSDLHERAEGTEQDWLARPLEGLHPVDGDRRASDSPRADGPGSARGPAAQGGDVRAQGIERRREPGPFRILVVEDNPVNQIVVTGYLEKLGYQAEIVDNGREAVVACGRTAYDLILMDCQMPLMDGFAATEAIRAEELRTGGRAWIAALTANTSTGVRDRCIAAGMDAFIAKPLAMENLERELSAALRHRAGREDFA